MEGQQLQPITLREEWDEIAKSDRKVAVTKWKDNNSVVISARDVLHLFDLVIVYKSAETCVV